MQRSYNTGNSSESWKRGPLVTNSGTVFRSDGSQALWHPSLSETRANHYDRVLPEYPQIVNDQPPPATPPQTQFYHDQYHRGHSQSNSNAGHGDMSYLYQTKDLMEIAYGDLKVGEELGSGGYGVVYKASWSGTHVAVKFIKKEVQSQITHKALEELRNEAKHHASFVHPNIVRLYGVCMERMHYGLVMEYMVKGSLNQVLQNGHVLPWKIRLQMAMDIVSGLTFLHTKTREKPVLLHRDIKSLNVLLDDRLRAKLTDFGLAKIKTSSLTITKGTMAGTVPWMAPEILNGEGCSEATDVYAMGMVFWEIAALDYPYSDSPLPEAKIKHDPIIHDPIPSDTPERFAALISRCWAQRAKDRPTAKTVADEMDQVLKHSI